MRLTRLCPHVQAGEPAFALATVFVLGLDVSAWPEPAQNGVAQISQVAHVCRACSDRLVEWSAEMVATS